jgi:hypothetical protein
VQGYDEIVVAYSDTKDVFGRDPAAGTRSDVLHAVIADGRMVGRWRAIMRGERVVLETRLHARPDGRTLQAIEAAAVRYGVFFGKEAVLELQRPAS